MSRRALRSFLKTSALLAMLCVPVVSMPAHSAGKNSFRVAWSVYVGWMPWDYAERSGILKKWADKYGIAIELKEVRDYTDSIGQYAAGKFDACAMTNIDMLTIPAARGVDSTALIVGDFSNGNDGIVIKGRSKQLTDIKGLPVNVINSSVSQYLLARALETIGLSERDVHIVATPEADLFARFMAESGRAVVTWKPRLTSIVALPDTTLVFDSSRIPGEIIDLMVVNTGVLQANPNLGQALVGAWYETLGAMLHKGAKGESVLNAMARASGTDLPSFKSQLATTRMFAKPAEAQGFMTGASVMRTMELVRTFSFTHGLLGSRARTVDAIGIEFPRGKTLGYAPR